MGNRMDMQGALDYLSSLAAFGIKPGLSRTRRLLELMDSPHLKYRTIHVTGTNGKGSVSSMLAQILKGAGIRTGLYTSPHLLRYEERMRVDGAPIEEAEFASVILRASECAARMTGEGMEPPTQFEVLTAAAMLHFAERGAEYAVIEAGLGGLLDSTNVISPVATVITNVTMEHADRCGGTLEGIAHHKAGIIKEGIPAVTAARGMPLSVIRETAREKHARLLVAGEDFSSEIVLRGEREQQMEFRADALGIPKTDYTLGLLGACQQENSAVGLAAAAVLRGAEPRITIERAARSLVGVRWPGRFERLSVGTIPVIIDGAHNPAGMEELRRSLDLWFPEEERVYLVGILRDKDYKGMLAALLRPSDKVVVTEPPSPRAASAEELARVAGRFAGHAEAVSEPGAALSRALELAGGEAPPRSGRLLVACGSLYLIGGIRERLI